MYTKADAMDYVDVKGLQLVRRDVAPIAKEVSQKVLDALMVDKSPDKALHQARTSVLRVLQGQAPLEDFILSKTLRSGYKNSNLPHVAVARKIKERTGTAPHSGERIPYVFIRDESNPNGLQTERAEDPQQVTSVDQLDLLYYVDHQMTSPLVGLLELVVENPMKAIFDHESVKAILDQFRTEHAALVKLAKRVKLNQTRKQHEITKFFTPRTSG